MNNNSKTLTVISADSLDVSGGPERVVIIRNDEGKGDGKHDTLYVVKSDGHSGKTFADG